MKFILSHKKISLMFFLFGVPLIINKTMGETLESSDVLLYYGALIGGVATLMAVLFTIQDGNKKREYDRKSEKIEEKVNFTRKYLFDTLQIFDVTNISIITIDPENPRPVIDKLDLYSIEIRRQGTLEMIFDEEQLKILCDALVKIKSYSTNYWNLVYELANTYDKINEYNLFASSLDLRNSLSRNPVENKDEILKLNEKIEKYKYKDINEISQTAFNIREKISELSKSDYLEVYNSVVKAIKNLEDYYENQLNTML